MLTNVASRCNSWIKMQRGSWGRLLARWFRPLCQPSRSFVGPDSFQEHAPCLWREGLAADPIFVDVVADVLQWSGSCLLLKSMKSSFNLFSREVRCSVVT